MSASVGDDLDEQICTLWVHNEAFSKEDVLLNTSTLPKGLATNKIFNISAFVSNFGIRDFHASTTTVPPGKNGHTEPASIAGGGRRNVGSKRDRSLGRDGRAKCFTLAAKDMDAELKTRYPNLQVIRVLTLIELS